MEFRFLGPLELLHNGQQLTVGGPRLRIVLAMLGLEANRVTPLERLIEAVWGTEPPATARSQIQICISGLRRTFADAGRSNAIATRASGYLLSIDAEELDVTRFGRMVASARDLAGKGQVAEAVEELHGALGLWRGPALQGVESDFVQRAATQLDEMRLTAIEERVRLELALNRHDKVIRELFELVEREPLRERLYGSLMLALYRAGRQAEALKCYRRMRAIFVNELGIEPGKELQQLETAILNHDPVLDLRVPDREADVPAAATGTGTGAGSGPVSGAPGEDTAADSGVVPPRQLPSDIADFTGRSEQLAEIVQSLGADQDQMAARYSVRVLAITGKGGVGKSALAVRAAHELKAHYPDGQLYANLRGMTGAAGSAEVLSRFLRALGVPGPAVPEDPAEGGSMYRSRLAAKRILVVLDDVVDEPLVQALLPGSPSCALIVTSRSRMTGLAGAVCINLEVFDNDLSIDLLADIAGQQRVRAELPAATQLAEFCAGLPLALRIGGARLAHRPHWPIAKLVRRLQDEAGRLDEFEHGGLELRSTISVAYRGVDVSAQRLFRLFALLNGEDFAAWTAAALLDIDVTESEDTLERLVDAQLLDVVVMLGEEPRYRYHDLIRIYAKERLREAGREDESRAAQERVLGCWLSLVRRAHRREYGGDFTVLHGDAALWELPDDVIDDLVEDPITWWESERRPLVGAVRQAAELGMDELCWDLALTSVTLFEAKGYFDDWRETAELALAVCEGAGNVRGAAAMRYSLGSLAVYQQDLQEAERLLPAAFAAFEEIGDLHGQSLVLRNMAQIDWLRGDHSAMLDKYDTALTGLRAVGDRAGEAHVLVNIAKARTEEDTEHESARDMLTAALAICRDIHCERVEAQVIFRLGELYLRDHEAGSAAQAFEWALRLVRRNRDQFGECHALNGLGRAQWRQGNLSAAEASLIQALRLAKQVGDRMIEGRSLLALGEIAMVGSGYEVARIHLAAARELFDRLGVGLLQASVRMIFSELLAAEADYVAAGAELAGARLILLKLGSPEAARMLAELTVKWHLIPGAATS